MILLLSFLSSPVEAAKWKNPDVVEDALAFATTDRKKAIILLEGALAEGPSDNDLPIITVHLAEQKRLAGDDDVAHEHFAKVLQLTTKSPMVDAARLGLALIGGIEPNERAVLDDVSDKEALGTQNADRYLYLALQAAKADDAGKTSSYTKKALSWAKEDPAVLQRVTMKLDAATGGGKTTSKKGDDPVAAAPKLTPLEQAEKAFADGNSQLARELAQPLAGDTSTREGLAASWLIKRIDANVTVDEGTIAVLLPLSGKFAAVGKQARQALEMGYRSAASQRRLVFVDSGGSAETVVPALEKAVLEMGVVAVVGPLLTPETEALVENANAARVPLLSLSQSLDDTEGLDWVFQGMLTLAQQIDALLDHTMGEREMKQFAVFAPESSYGKRATGLFEKAVAARGGVVTVQQFYDPKANDLIPFAKKLGRKDYEARAEEFRQIKKDTQKRGGDPSKAVLPPKLDFDALFIPDKADRLPMAAAALAYEEFPIGEFQTVRDGPTVPLLGLSAWNKYTLYTRGGPYVRSSVFTDAFLPPPPDIEELRKVRWEPDALTSTFATNYQTETGRSPTTLEAVIHDTGLLLAEAALSNATDRATFREALLAATPGTTITGVVGVDAETRSTKRNIRLLTVTKNGIFPVEPVAEDEEPQQGGQ